MRLKEQIELGKIKIEEAKLIYIQHLREYEAIKLPIEYEQKSILDKFREAINDQREERTTCRCCMRYYDAAWFTSKGIGMMMIDADHPNDIIRNEWAWEEVEYILLGLEG